MQANRSTVSRKEKRQARKTRREERRASSQRPNSNVYDIAPQQGEHRAVYARTKLKAMNQEQQRVLNAIDNSTVTVISGRVGSGKTFIAAAKATELLLDPSSPVEKIYLIRSPEPLGRSVGHLPGDKMAKMEAMLSPILGGIEHVVGTVGKLRLMEQGKLEAILVEHLRGQTFNNCAVIFDECNNLSERATAVALLRTGRDCKVMFCGDQKQSDIRSSGMALFSRMLEEYERLPFMYCELTKTVRSDEASAFASIFEELGIEY